MILACFWVRPCVCLTPTRAAPVEAAATLMMCCCISMPLPACLPLMALQVLRWCGFSDDFRNEMVFPLTALFFGTGNQVQLPPPAGCSYMT